MFPQVGAFAGSSATRTPASLTTTGQPPVTHDYSVGVSAAWEIDFFGRLQSLNDQALQQYFATAQARKAVEILLVSEVADQYLTLLAFDELLAVTQRTLETAQASYKLTLLQFQTGTGTELSVRQSETVVEQAKANHSVQLRGRAQAENALVLLLGQPLPADLPPVASLNDQTILADIPAGLPSELLTRRPDIMQAEATLRGANANIGAARAAFFPTISLTGSLGTASSALAGLFKAGSLAWSFLPSDHAADLRGGQAAGQPRRGDAAKGHQRRPVRKGDPDGVSRSGRRPRGARHLRRRGRVARTLYRGRSSSSLDLSELRFRNGVDNYLTANGTGGGKPWVTAATPAPASGIELPRRR